jgi:hypothetical protein
LIAYSLLQRLIFHSQHFFYITNHCNMADKINIESMGDTDTRHVDDVAAQEKQREGPNATGARTEDIDAKYWLSSRFIGSCLAIIFVANSLFFGYAIPVNILNVINADLGNNC